ncbi:hypothetical protein Goshw_020020 [Gossypium schwendimanii]|uniref:Uncharacterized protein n=1 Tax=Gossypium schwendimanii TaxID=34291 RepID=A0A7J9MV56_GOSSC|nr:hypothetical protein [Gossypium schwendimanii]
MDTPEEDSSSSKYIENITIPSALIQKSFGEAGICEGFQGCRTDT